MRKVILLEHISLDGYLAGPNGEMDWIRVGDEMWDYVDPLTERADAAIFGRKTYEMMVSYWPAAGDNPNATAHDKNHSRWLNAAKKVVVSRTLKLASWPGFDNVSVVGDDLASSMREIKGQPGKDLLLIGSASMSRSFIHDGLIDEYHLMLNPVVLGSGTPLFPEGGSRQNLGLVAARTLASGVVALHYKAPCA